MNLNINMVDNSKEGNTNKNKDKTKSKKQKEIIDSNEETTDEEDAEKVGKPSTPTKNVQQ